MTPARARRGAAAVARSAMVLGLTTSVLAGTAPAAAPSADALITAARKDAAASHKAVFIEFGASWCGPCRALEAMLSTPAAHNTLSQHYVFVKLTIWEHDEKAPLNNPGADKLFTDWGGDGIPFYVITDVTGQRLGSGNDYPDSSKGIRAFLSLVDRTAPGFAPTERETLAAALATAGPGYGSVAGRVLDAEHRPVARASVSLVADVYLDGQWTAVKRQTVKTDDHGAYTVENVDAGQYRVLAEPPAIASGRSGPETSAIAETFFPSATALAAARNFSVRRGQGVAGLDIAARPAVSSRVAGTVTSSAGAPQARATVTLTSVESPLRHYSVQTGTDGAFVVTGVEAGPYNLLIRTTGNGRPDEPAEIAFQPVAVTAPEVAGLRISTSGGGMLSGSVAFGTELSPADRGRVRVAAVAVHPAPGAPVETRRSSVDAAGHFDLGGVVGPRVIRVENLPVGWILKSIRARGADVTDAPIEADRDGRLNGIEVVVTSRGAELSGRATDESGQAMKGGVVILYPSAAPQCTYPSRFVKSAAVQPDGTFTISSLPAGDYLAAALPSLDDAWSAPEALARLREQAVPVALAEGQHAAITLRMPKTDR